MSQGGNRRRTGGAAANGFGPRNLTIEEAWALYHAEYPTPPDMRLPSGWKLSAGGIGIPRVPTPLSDRWTADVYRHREEALTAEERASPLWNPDNIQQWEVLFRQRRAMELPRHGGGLVPPRSKNIDEREHFWAVPGRTLAAVMEHIDACGEPMPPPPPPARWEPTTSSRSSSSCSSSSTPKMPTLIAPKSKVKEEAESPPRKRTT